MKPNDIKGKTSIFNALYQKIIKGFFRRKRDVGFVAGMDGPSSEQSEVNMGVANYKEQRWSQRRNIELPVDLFHAGVRLASCQTRDVGLGGVFLAVESNKPSLDSDVELLFRLDKDGTAQTNRKLRARVVRAAADGVGLIFRDFDTNSFRTLQEIMRHVPVENA